MKKLIAPFLFLTFLFASCSTDDTALTDSAAQAPQQHEKFSVKTNHTPENTLNTYDTAGKLHKDMFIEYLSHYNSATTLSGIITGVEAVANNNATFTTIRTGYTGLVQTNVQSVLSSTSSAIISNSSASATGKQKLTSFVAMIDGFETAAYNTTYDNIVAFEQTIISDNTLTANDKRIILTTTSVARFAMSCYDKDRGWNRTKVGILSTVSGTNMAEAVNLSITCNVAS
jgi:hypothetical protein